VYRVQGDSTNALDISVHFPRLKGINWFNHYKIEAEAQNSYVNWTVTSNAVVRETYYERLRGLKGADRYFLRAADLRGVMTGWDCQLEGWTNLSTHFSISIDTNVKYGGRGSLRVVYDGAAANVSTQSAVVHLSALAEPLYSWSNYNAVGMHVRVPTNVASASVRLIMQSAETGWDVLGTVGVTNNGQWQEIRFPYAWANHDSSSWLNVWYQFDLPNGSVQTIHLDEVKLLIDSHPYSPAQSAYISTWWGSLAAYTGNQADDDGDGMNNLEEFIAGTVPVPPGGGTNFFKVTQIGLTNVPGVVVRAPTVTGRLYRLWATPALAPTANWSQVSGPVAGTGGLISVTNSAAPPIRFFRLSVELQDP
jgi:hypothetical protein